MNIAVSFNFPLMTFGEKTTKAHPSVWYSFIGYIWHPWHCAEVYYFDVYAWILIIFQASYNPCESAWKM